jgi:hypothetical protein
MKLYWMTLLLFAGLILPSAGRAQISLYAEGGASDLAGGTGAHFLYGGAGGILFNVPVPAKHILLSADIQSRYVQSSGERFIVALVGARLTIPLNKFGLNPYGEGSLGFGRYRASTAPGAENTSDNVWQVQAGVTRRLAPRLDLVADYDYSQFGADNGRFNPKNFNAGVVIRLNKR